MKKRNHIPYLAVIPLMALTLCLASLGAEAQVEGELEQIVVGARGYPALLQDIPGTVVIAQEEDVTLAPMHGSIADALDNLPGVFRTGESPFAQDISIRGLSGTSIVVLVDGKRINTATDLNARLGYVNPADVERIEVLEGPVTALYGSGSLGGVVNIVTRKPEGFFDEPGVEGKVTLTGSTNPLGGSTYGYLAFGGPKATGAVAVAYRNFGSVYGAGSQKVPNSQFSDKYGRLFLRFRPSDNVTLTTTAIRSDIIEAGLPGGNSSMPGIANITYPKGDFTMISQAVEVELQGALKKIEAEIYYTSNRRRVIIDRVGPVPPGNAQPLLLTPWADHETWGGKLTFHVEGAGHNLVAGADFWTWDLDTGRTRTIRTPANIVSTTQDKPSPKSDQLSVGIFFSDTFKPHPDWTFYFGGRVDRLRTRNEDFYIVNPATGARTFEFASATHKDWGWQAHLGTTWKFKERWSTSLLLSSAYRAADLMERFKYISLGGTRAIYGEPSLKPERSLFGEYAIAYEDDDLSLRLSVFCNLIDDYIAEKTEITGDRRLHNVKAARITGAELRAWKALGHGLSLRGNVSWLEGRDRENDQPLPGIAPLNALLGLEYRSGSPFWARLDQRFIASQHRTPSVPLPVSGTEAAFITNFTAGLSFGETVRHNVTFSINNIFDNKYQNYLANQRGITLWEPGVSAQLTYTLDF